ncbi:MAG TPA: 2-hydroxy-3-oxopropionate reductase [Nitrolancea sp.]|nr:2-hydroxy-3-oxopropionate reductase [Nitrolancea sp.]
MAESLGFIGLGIMGKPMALNLLKAGYKLVVHSRSRGPVDELVQAGATAAASPSAVAGQVKTVITMLPDSPDVRLVALGPDGLIDSMGQGSLLIDMSTISPLVTQEVAGALAEKGAGMVDAPVSGGDKGAIAASLSIMAGGSEADFARALPIFQALGKTIVHVGDIGAGQIVKACNQVVVAINFEALSEALVLGSKAGVDPEKILQVLGGGLAGSKVLELRGQSMLAHNFQPGFRLRLHRKDLNIALSTARSLDVPLPVTALVDQFITALVAAGRGNLDHSAILTELEDLAHYTVGSGEQREE